MAIRLTNLPVQTVVPHNLYAVYDRADLRHYEVLRKPHGAVCTCGAVDCRHMAMVAAHRAGQMLGVTR